MNNRFLLRNVVPIGFSSPFANSATDVAIVDGAVERIGRDIAGEYEAVDYRGAYISPAWVDMHAHLYWGGSDIAIRHQDVGLRTGVPILVDAGSAGEGHFLGLREYIVKPARERIVPFLNVGSIGLVATNRVPEVRMMRDIDIERIEKTVSENPGLIAGLKLRLCSIIDSETDILPLKLAKKLSRVLKLPLMVHIGMSLPLVEEVMDRLDAGDIVTHCFHGKPASSVVDDEVAFEAARRAADRGVFFDIGHGSASFSYRVGRKCLERNLYPDIISSDLHSGNIEGPVWDLSVVLSKLLELGLPLEKVIAGATSGPRRALSMPEADLAPGAEAAFTIFSTVDADVNLPDSLGDVMHLSRRIIPKAVFWKGELSEAASRL